MTSQVNGHHDGIAHGKYKGSFSQKKKKISILHLRSLIKTCRSHTVEQNVTGFPLNLLQVVSSDEWIAGTVAQATAEICSVRLVKTLALHQCL